MVLSNRGKKGMFVAILLCVIPTIIFHHLMAHRYYTKLEINCVPVVIPVEMKNTKCSIYEYTQNISHIYVSDVCNETNYSVVIPSPEKLHYDCDSNSTSADQINTNLFDLTSNYTWCVQYREKQIGDTSFVWILLGIMIFLIMIPFQVFMFTFLIVERLNYIRSSVA